MTNVASLLPLLPIVIPIVSTGGIWVLSSGKSSPWLRRWLYAATLLITFLCLFLLALLRHDQVDLPFWQSLFVYGRTLAFASDPLALSLALVFSGAFALVGIAMLPRPMERFEVATSLLLVGASMGTFLSENLLTLCLSWGLVSIVLLTADIIRVPEESIPHAIRNTLGNLISTLALIAATVLFMVESDETRFALLPLLGMPLKLLMVAALLRLSVYPPWFR
jgi:hypothetical protein